MSVIQTNYSASALMERQHQMLGLCLHEPIFIFLANGHVHRSLGQRPRCSTATGPFGQRPYSIHLSSADSLSHVDYGRWPNEPRCGTNPRGVTPGYDEHGLWPTILHAEPGYHHPAPTEQCQYGVANQKLSTLHARRP